MLKSNFFIFVRYFKKPVHLKKQLNMPKQKKSGITVLRFFQSRFLLSKPKKSAKKVLFATCQEGLLWFKKCFTNTKLSGGLLLD